MFVESGQASGFRSLDFTSVEILGGCTGDYDNDGDIDVYLTQTNWSCKKLDASYYLFRNRGDGVFEDVTAEAGIENPVHCTFQRKNPESDKTSRGYGGRGGGNQMLTVCECVLLATRYCLRVNPTFINLIIVQEYRELPELESDHEGEFPVTAKGWGLPFRSTHLQRVCHVL